MGSKNDDTPSVGCMKNGFLVVPFKLPQYKTLAENGNELNKFAYHYAFVRKHESRNDFEQNSLFVANLPLLSNVDKMKKVITRICERYNTIAYVEDLLYYDEFGLQEIDLSSLTSSLLNTEDQQDKRYTPRNTCILKFVDEDSCKNCLKALKKYSEDGIDNEEKYLQWEYTSPSISTFLNFYKPLDTEHLKESISEDLSTFAQREEEEKESAQTSIVDEDGFTLVVGKNTKSLNSIKKKIFNKNPLLKHNTKTKPKSMLDKKIKEDFYRFQVREKKKQEINQLLSKFKEDQERIKIMKSKRKFNPYT